MVSVPFKEIFNSFESTVDTVRFSDSFKSNGVGTRFLLLRSLDRQHLVELLDLLNYRDNKGKYEVLLEQVYNSPIQSEEIVKYINEKRRTIISERHSEEEGLHKIIKNFGEVTCGLRNDRIDDIVKAIVRDKTIKSINTLHEKISNVFIPRIKNYILWSFYNQITNDLIEHYFVEHPKIIPTLRKIPNIDFFLKIEDALIPFDLKITHIAEDFFDMYFQGLIENDDDYPDSFSVNKNNLSEIKQIKEFYRTRKSMLSLPNYGMFTKKELLDTLECSGDGESIKFVRNMYENRGKMVGQISTDLKKLEWWNFKYQGERLFANNNRLFLFFAYTNAFEDGRPIKGKLDIVRSAVRDLLNNINEEQINSIRYKYAKDRSLRGDYCAKSLSVLITDSK